MASTVRSGWGPQLRSADAAGAGSLGGLLKVLFLNGDTQSNAPNPELKFLVPKSGVAI